MNGHDTCAVTEQENDVMAEAKQVSIGDAESWYGQEDGIVSSSTLREVIKWLLQNNLRTDFENDSYLDALVLTELMLDRSVSSIRIFAGPGCDGFLSTLRKTFIEAVKRLETSGGKVQILLLDDTSPAFISEIRDRFRGTLEVGLLKIKPGSEPIGHFFVFDSLMARVEQPHDRLTKETPVNAIKAKVHFNNPGLAQILETRFDAFWAIFEQHYRTSSEVASSAAN